MTKPKVIVKIVEGCVENVYSTEPGVEVVVVDIDKNNDNPVSIQCFQPPDQSLISGVFDESNEYDKEALQCLDEWWSNEDGEIKEKFYHSDLNDHYEVNELDNVGRFECDDEKCILTAYDDEEEDEIIFVYYYDGVGDRKTQNYLRDKNVLRNLGLISWRK